MTPAREAVYAALVALAMLLMFGMVALLASDNRRLDAEADRWRNVVLHLQETCDQRADGSAVCEPGAWKASATNHSADCPCPAGETNLGTLIWRGELEPLLACPDVSHDTVVAPWRRRRRELRRVGGRVVLMHRTDAPRFDRPTDPSPKPPRRAA